MENTHEDRPLPEYRSRPHFRLRHYYEAGSRRAEAGYRISFERNPNSDLLSGCSELRSLRAVINFPKGLVNA